MGISGKPKVFGMFLGPDVEWDSWRAPLCKCRTRRAMIAAGGSVTQATSLSLISSSCRRGPLSRCPVHDDPPSPPPQSRVRAACPSVQDAVSLLVKRGL
eukprot:7783086-Pyramimonas_sp.AAC.1